MGVYGRRRILGRRRYGAGIVPALSHREGHTVKPKIKRFGEFLWTAEVPGFMAVGFDQRSAYLALRGELKRVGYHPTPPPLKRAAQRRP